MLYDVDKLCTLQSDIFEVTILGLFRYLERLDSVSQVRLVLHAGLNDPRKLVLIFILQLINLFPRLVIMHLPFFQVLLPYLCFQVKQLLSILDEFLRLQPVLPFKLLQYMTVMRLEFLYSCREHLGLFLYFTEQLLILVLITLHLIGILLCLLLDLYLMLRAHRLQPAIVHLLHVSLGSLDGTEFLLVLCLLCGDALLDELDLCLEVPELSLVRLFLTTSLLIDAIS